jgi:pyruvate ferredoxin oxidoreductase alpha subunit
MNLERGRENQLSMNYVDFSAIAETTAKVHGHELRDLETYKDFSDKGTAVPGGSSSYRFWDDKVYVPLTISEQCVDCLHCVIACPHSSIDHNVSETTGVSSLLASAVTLASKLPGLKQIDLENLNHSVEKGQTSYDYCKGCFVCATACPVDAIHFVKQSSIKEEFDGNKISVNDLDDIFEIKSHDFSSQAQTILTQAKAFETTETQPSKTKHKALINGSDVLVDFIFSAGIDNVCMFPITPNGKVLSGVEERSRNPLPDDHPVKYRATLSEEAGYAFLTGAAARGDRTLICQGSQSLAQIYEFMNISPGLRLPIMLLEMTRSLSPGTSIKPDHTTTMRTCNTGEIVLFGRGPQDCYDKSLLLLKTMESDSVWLPGRLVVKGFVDTHTVSTSQQVDFEYVDQNDINNYLGRPKNPYVLAGDEVRAMGVLNLESRYHEEKCAMDENLINAGDKFKLAAEKLSEVTGRKAIQKLQIHKETEQVDLLIVALNDPDLATAEYVASELNKQGQNCGAVSISLYRPFPGNELREACRGAKAIAVLEFDNWSGRDSGGVLSQEVRSALHMDQNSAPVIAIQAGLGGRALTISYFVLIYRMLADMAEQAWESQAGQWIKENADETSVVLGARGHEIPKTSQDFDIPMLEDGVHHLMVVGRGGQGVMLLNNIIAGAMEVTGKACSSMAAYGALQRGGGISLSIKVSDKAFSDQSDIIMADTIVSLEDDLSLEAMLPQLMPGGTLIIDCNQEKYDKLSQLRSDIKIIVIPASEIAALATGNAARTNMVMLGAVLTKLGINDFNQLDQVLKQVCSIPHLDKMSKLLAREDNLNSIRSGFLTTQNKGVMSGYFKSEKQTQSSTNHELETLKSELPAALINEKTRAKKTKQLQLKKRIYQTAFKFHPLVNQFRSVLRNLKKKESPLSTGDMACPGCGQINIFRNVFNYLSLMQKDKGQLYVSEQDGCGTVFTSMDSASTWNIPFIRIAFETAHGVAAGLVTNQEKQDMVVSVSGDGGFMQGIRSVEDTLHQQDPILHIIAVNQTLGNTGGQATATTMVGKKTREGHVARCFPVDLLSYAEQHNVPSAQASTVHLEDLYKKLRKAHQTVVVERRPFVLMMYFSCLEQGVNLANSLIMQKQGLDAHFINLYSTDFKPVRNRMNEILYYRKKVNIDWFPMTYGKKQWKSNLAKYFKYQKISADMAEDDEALDRAYWHLRGQWEKKKQAMGPVRYWLKFTASFFSVYRITMKRLISKEAPPQSK